VLKAVNGLVSFFTFIHLDMVRQALILPFLTLTRLRQALKAWQL